MKNSEVMRYNVKYGLFADINGNIYWRDPYGNIHLKHTHINRDGYTYVVCGHQKKKLRVHRIVAETFIPNPDNKPEVDHKNRNRTDNRVKNLRWVTKLENLQNRSNKHKKHKKHIFTEPHSEFGRLFFKTFGIMRADDPKFYARMRARYQYHGHF